MKKLWQKNWKMDSFIEAFETEGDLLLDQKLVKFDVLCSLAHIAGLTKIGILKPKEFHLLAKGLWEILNLNKIGKFILQAGDEDIHTKIENYLTQKYSSLGQKLQTGRSRNDQVLTDIRLFIKEQLFFVWQETLNVAFELCRFAKKHESLPMPGYTHMQKAMPSSVGLWAASFAEGLLDDLVFLKAAFSLNDQSPLGSAAGYGVPLSLDKEYTAELLGFAKGQTNPLSCQNSRGKIEGAVVASLIALMSEINKLASDILLFTTSEFNFFEPADKLCSGSSLMPQKNNLDVAELLRGKTHILLGNYVQLISLSSNLISGYNRDLQDSKKPVWESLKLVNDSLKAASILVANLKPQKAILEKSLTPEIFATHQALALAKSGLAFRKAYLKVSQNLSLVKGKFAKGGELGLGKLENKIKKEQKILGKEKEKYFTAITKLQKIAEGGEKHVK